MIKFAEWRFKILQMLSNLLQYYPIIVHKQCWEHNYEQRK